MIKVVILLLIYNFFIAKRLTKLFFKDIKKQKIFFLLNRTVFLLFLSHLIITNFPTEVIIFNIKAIFSNLSFIFYLLVFVVIWYLFVLEIDDD